MKTANIPMYGNIA